MQGEAETPREKENVRLEVLNSISWDPGSSVLYFVSSPSILPGFGANKLFFSFFFLTEETWYWLLPFVIKTTLANML